MRILAMALGLAAALVGDRPAGAQDAPTSRPPWVKATAPKGWSELPGLSRSVATTLAQSSAFGDVRGRAGAQAFAQPGTGAFYVSWLVADKPAPDAMRAVRLALDSVRNSRIAASPDARSTEELGYQESVKDGIAEATLEWRHVSNETLSLVHAYAWVTTAGAPRLLKGECVISTSDGKAPHGVEADCRIALESLRADVPNVERGAIAQLPDSPPPEPAVEDPVVVPGVNDPPAAVTPQDTVGAAPPGDHKVLYTGPPKQEEGSSSNRWFVLLGGALLLVAFYLTFRARARAAAAPTPVGVTADPVPDPVPASDPEAKDEDEDVKA